MPGSLTIPTLHLRDRLILSVAEVCALTAMNQSTVYRLIKAGTLPARRRGGRALLVLRKDLDAYLESLPSASRSEYVAEKDNGDDNRPSGGHISR